MAASITAQLTINSNTATSDSLNLLVNKVLTTKEPTIGIARTSVAGTKIALVATSVSDVTYIYAKNTDNTNTAVFSDGAGNAIMDLGPGEFTFIPVKATKGLQVEASSSAVVVEYALFTKS